MVTEVLGNQVYNARAARPRMIPIQTLSDCNYARIGRLAWAGGESEVLEVKLSFELCNIQATARPLYDNDS